MYLIKNWKFINRLGESIDICKLCLPLWYIYENSFSIIIILYCIHGYRRYGRSTRPLMVAHTTTITSASSPAGKNQTTWNPRQRSEFKCCLSELYLLKRSRLKVDCLFCYNPDLGSTKWWHLDLKTRSEL